MKKSTKKAEKNDKAAEIGKLMIEVKQWSEAGIVNTKDREKVKKIVRMK